MKDAELKERLREALWSVVDRHPGVLSATLTGSFVDRPTLEGISDIDFVVVLDRIDAKRYQSLLTDFDGELRPLLAEAGYRLHINPTLGPLKFNEPDLAVLHLMLYSREGHVEHVIQSPFTCLDWQRSSHVRKKSLGEVYPVFGLQPRHFLSSRRSLGDYLKDFRSGTVSYRELHCDREGYREVKCGKPMTVRDRHEFAYHVVRFLMRNLLKLIGRTSEVPTGDALLDAFFAAFPERASAIRSFFDRVAVKKQRLDFADPLPDLDTELEAFFAVFESQFRRAFFDEATRHVVFRHAETPNNRNAANEVVFLGQTDAAIAPTLSSTWDDLADRAGEPVAVYSSPLLRCRQSLSKLGFDVPVVDDRLREVEYGAAEGMSTRQARAAFPQLFAAWDRGEDAPFPDGETTESVAERVTAFVRDHWESAAGDTLTCTHNVVLRCLVGDALGVPRRDWFRIRVPHLAPITFIQTKRFGRFVDLDESVERTLFQCFAA